MRYVFPTRSRTGSQFILKLAFSLRNFNRTNNNYAGVTGSRQNTNEKGNSFKKHYIEGKGLEYLIKNKIEIMKFEDPGDSNLIYDIANHFPDCLFIASHRQLEKVINSHYNIKSWGHSLEYVLNHFKLCIHIYEKLHITNRLFLIDVDRPEIFSLDNFCNFMGLQPSENSFILAKNWKPINDLKYQIEKHDVYDKKNIKEHPECQKLRDYYPWVNDIELRYQKLVNDINKV